MVRRRCLRTYAGHRERVVEGGESLFATRDEHRPPHLPVDSEYGGEFLRCRKSPTDRDVAEGCQGLPGASLGFTLLSLVDGGSPGLEGRGQPSGPEHGPFHS
jgi:hypothetical protein